MSAADREFNRGYVIAVCNLVNLHDNPVLAGDTFEQLGLTYRQALALLDSEYDRSALRKLKRENPRSFTDVGAVP